jgi:general transcription factor 3C polypeptide 5 (transcription factor C subunit 1)
MSGHGSSSSEAESSSAPRTGTALHRHLPRTAFAAIEYPSTVSHPSALLRVISQDKLNHCFNIPTSVTNVPLEMSYLPAGTPLRGIRVPSSKLLLRVRKRRRRDAATEDEGRGEGSQAGGNRDVANEQGVFVAEVVGPITQTVRFRRELLIVSPADGRNGRLSLHAESRGACFIHGLGTQRP